MIILASGSPRRKELLSLIDNRFTIITSDVDETPTETEPEKIVEELSLRKGEDVLEKIKADFLQAEDNTLVISADTLVFFGNERMGKPVDKEDAIRMLTSLSGNSHKVITGVTLKLISKGKIKTKTFHSVTEVFVEKLTNEEIKAYVASGEPMDKAGAYAIQGLFSKHITGIKGDYNNVVGLPVSALYNAMKEIGYVR